MLKYLDRENFEMKYRQRLLFEMESATSGQNKRQLALNEVFVAEKNVGASSIYRISVDGDYIGKFKSSGMIISTGTGSTGWLHSAKRFTEHDVAQALSRMGANGEPGEAVKKLADDLTEKTRFPQDHPELYYYVREPTIMGDYEGHWEGFAKHIEFLSELIDGRVSIDGLSSIDVGLGETFTVECRPEHSLKIIKFIL
jgi:NAD+ kinase